MRVSRLVWVGLLAIGVAWPRISPAQTIQERIEILEEKIKERVEALPVDIHALVVADYQYSFNRPGSHDVPLHVFDLNAQSFMINDAALFFSRQREDESFGFMVSFDFGKTSQVVNGVNETTPSLREAYLTYKTPLEIPTTEAPITIKAGKFVTLLGQEVIKTWSNFNYNIANTIEFGFGIPFTHVGALINLPLAEFLSLDLGPINGWDVQTDNNNGLSFLGGLGITPLDMLSFYIAGTYGPEQANRSGASQRGVMTWVATLKPIDVLTLIVSGTWGNETNIPLPAKGGAFGTANWFGSSFYFIWQITEPLQFVLRPEVFDDPEGARTGGFTSSSTGGNPDAPSGAGTVWAITPTVAYQLTDHLLARVEYRYDRASRRYFDFDSQRSDGSSPIRRTSNVILMEAIYAF